LSSHCEPIVYTSKVGPPTGEAYMNRSLLFSVC